MTLDRYSKVLASASDKQRQTATVALRLLQATHILLLP